MLRRLRAGDPASLLRQPDYVRYLLDHGANAGWVAPNGIPVLEYALLRYWNGEAVDLVAARLLVRFGSSTAKLHEELERVL